LHLLVRPEILQPMPTFDVHQHLWPEEVVALLSARTEPPCLRGSTLQIAGEEQSEIDLEDHNLERRLERLDRDETEVAIVSLQPTLGFERLPDADRTELASAWHAGARRFMSSSGGRVRAFSAGQCLDGFAGACVSAQAVVAGGPDFETLLEELVAHGQVLFVHPGPGRPPKGAPLWWSGVVDYTAQMQAAYVAWLVRRPNGGPRPSALFAILAGGAPIQLERLLSRGGDERLALDSSVFLDVASYGRRAIELSLATFGVGQLVFGSDFPVVEPASTLRAIHAFGDAVATAIREDNPALLFG
jgi:6-methylsalicylate decarboxylase